MKEYIKYWIKKLPIAITKNQQYDQQTLRVMKRHLRPNSNCVDVGCHKGEMLEVINKLAPQGQHFGFEPLPHLFKALPGLFPDNCHFYDIALSDEKGESTFNYVISNPAYSGFIKRSYDRPNEEDTTITVQRELLDVVLPDDLPIHLIKIDVEGAELQVLKGAEQTLQRYKPLVIFEHGIGASDLYGTQPDEVFEFLETCGLQIYLMKDWLKGKAGLTKKEFRTQYEKQLNYYFMAI